MLIHLYEPVNEVQLGSLVLTREQTLYDNQNAKVVLNMKVSVNSKTK